MRQLPPAVIAWMTDNGTLTKLKKVSDDGQEKLEKANRDAKLATSKLTEQRSAADAGQISMVEMNSANYNTWELVLNDEPYSDGVAALMALADRHLSRGEAQISGKLLQEALEILSQLEQSESDHVSPEDRWQVQPLLRRVKLRLAWLSQGRDPYGRFATQAPPRRLKALIAQFTGHLKRYAGFLQQARERVDTEDRLLRGSLLLDMQRNEANHAAQRAEREMEKSRRQIANAQLRISSFELRNASLRGEMDRGEIQYRKGSARAEKAVSDLGAMALKAASAYLPVPAPIADLGINTGELIKAITVVNDVSSGKPPFQVLAIAYGQDLIDMSFASFDANDLLKGALKNGVSEAVSQFAKNGTVDLKNLSNRTMQRLGEDMFRESCARLGRYLESELPDTEFYRTAKEQWISAKSVF